ncbi:hypothetical protein PAE9249_04342 [Paenibacillus sp. CECT 9249]|uniref:DUF2905 domain-containing protein n=1 Tax=Paenibacillus sp. CECT 9249 TaxID=2845385 RepID=UPI001E5182F6|nr:DUF2905 domain-containing protein [Paenibacillus sp. CECT 9249]CAH0121808.1 hypothetical protein PAE9249_04342 [Paenibacillus sp. CECT 9249]
MDNMPKLLIIAGIVLIVIGAVWAFGGKWLQFGRLPGDIVVEKENFTFYFPIVTCIVISVVASIVMYLFRLFK